MKARPNDARAPRREILRASLEHIPADRRIFSFAEDAAAIRRALAVREALKRVLTEKQREVVEAHYFEGLSQGEIAERLGITQQVVQKRLHGVVRNGRTVGGALRKLREALAPLVES